MSIQELKQVLLENVKAGNIQQVQDTCLEHAEICRQLKEKILSDAETHHTWGYEQFDNEKEPLKSQRMQEIDDFYGEARKHAKILADAVAHGQRFTFRYATPQLPFDVQNLILGKAGLR